MAATIPATLPPPSPNFVAYERTTQSFFFNVGTATAPVYQVSGNQAQVGQGAPANAIIYGMVGVVARGQLPYNLVVQVDVSGGTLAAGLTLTLLGSLDGVNFYPLGSEGSVSAGGIFPFAGILARYITAALTGFTVATGTPQVTASFSA
jgi:hypothetical protein